MEINLGVIIGFVLFLAILVVVFAKFWSKAKKEVPPDVAAKMEYIESSVEAKLNKIENYLRK